MVLFVSCDKGQRSKIVIDRYEEGWFENSHNIGQRKYRVYLPHSYSDTPTKSYPILYMMDGQNLFFDELSYSGIAWRIQHVSDSLVQASSIREFIIVGIDHAGEKRFSEYLPQKPFESLSVEEEKLLEQLMGYAFYSDDFLRFLPIPKCKSSCIFINCLMETSSNFPLVAIIPVTYGLTFATSGSTLIPNCPFFLMLTF